MLTSKISHRSRSYSKSLGTAQSPVHMNMVIPSPWNYFFAAWEALFIIRPNFQIAILTEEIYLKAEETRFTKGEIRCRPGSGPFSLGVVLPDFELGDELGNKQGENKQTQ